MKDLIKHKARVGRTGLESMESGVESMEESRVESMAESVLSTTNLLIYSEVIDLDRLLKDDAVALI